MNEENNNQQINNTIQPVEQNNMLISDEELVKAYVGEKYNEFVDGSFNPYAFFFNIFYFYYRKLFLYGVLLFIVTTILFGISGVVSLLLDVVLGLVFNKFYLSVVKKRVAKIRSTHPTATNEQLKEICANQGNTSMGLVFAGFAMHIGIAVIIFLFFYTTFMAFFDFSSPSIDSHTNDSTNPTFNGTYRSSSDIDLNTEFSVKVPSKFENKSFDESEIYYAYSGKDGTFNKCRFRLVGIEEYNNSKDLIKQMHDYYKENKPSNIKTDRINGIEWDYFSYNGSFGEVYYYASEKDNQVYLMEYEIQEDADKGCPGYREEIINSVESK